MVFIKHHWFGLLSGAIVFVFMGLFMLVLLSPREDARNRGFIPCTQALAAQLLDCGEEQRIFCVAGAVLQNTWCDMKVVGAGFGGWISGNQAAPWSNYIFIPEKGSDAMFDEAARAEYLKNNPQPALEMEKLRQLNKELENEIIREEVDEDEKPR